MKIWWRGEKWIFTVTLGLGVAPGVISKVHVSRGCSVVQVIGVVVAMVVPEGNEPLQLRLFAVVRPLLVIDIVRGFPPALSASRLQTAVDGR